ncbi:MAG: hypothetical protein HZA23_07205 [Nitrospirae bacterium]|nr:hypothetical protein [Nitrospirota bacterium]
MQQTDKAGTIRESYEPIGSQLTIACYKKKWIAPSNRESVLMGTEVPEIDLSAPEHREVSGALAPGLSTCTGCAAPTIFNLVARAANMRESLLRKALLDRGAWTAEDLAKPGLMPLLLKEEPPAAGELSKAGIPDDLYRLAVEIKTDLKRRGLYFKLIFCGATGCMTVTTAAYPNNIWRFPYFHSAFENIGAMVSGIESAARTRLERGDLRTPHKVIGFAGDGGTFDIGLQALSGLWERNQDTLVITYDNEAYMNTGKQRCSSTPWGANTTTAPVGRVVKGKQTNPKDIIAIALAHNIPYVAQASPDDPVDLMIKVRKALLIPGAAYLRILAPCPPGWTYPANQSIDLAKQAVDSATFYSFEVETDNGNFARYFTLSRLPHPFFDKTEGHDALDPYISPQARFQHMKGAEGQAQKAELQRRMDTAWKNMARFFGLS